MLAYTRNKLMVDVATIERDMSSQDALGATDPSDWQTLSTPACLLSWAKSEGGRSVNRTYVSANREVPVQEGSLLMPLWTDVTENDRITQITDQNGTVLVGGLFEISSVVNQITHLEVGVVRMHLGA